MKRLHHFVPLLVALVLLAGCFNTSHDRQDRPITLSALPTAAQEFLARHYADVKIKEITIEKRARLMQYNVDLKGGIDVQFDRNGVCTEIECKKPGHVVPDEVIPAPILQQVRSLYPDAPIVKYEHNQRLYEIDLADGTELTFNRAMRLIDIDHHTVEL